MKKDVPLEPHVSERLRELGDELSGAQAALDEAEDRWLALSEELENR